MGPGDPPFWVPCSDCEGGSGALLFLSAMLSEDPKNKFSMLPRGEPEGLGLMFGGARDEWRLEKVPGDSDETLERVDSERSGEGLK